TRRTSPRHGRRTADDGRGSEVSRGGLFQDQLLERQVRHSLAQPVVLFLELLQPLYLVTLQAAELLAPPIVCKLRHADRANRFSDRSALRQQHVDLAQLRHDLFRPMLLLGHSNVLLRLNSLLQGGPLFRGQTKGISWSSPTNKCGRSRQRSTSGAASLIGAPRSRSPIFAASSCVTFPPRSHAWR